MKKVFLFFLTLAIFTSCSTSVKTTYDHKVDFSKYKTFCWMQGCDFKFTGPGYLKDSLISDRIKKAIIEELAKKGITQNTDNPDLLVAFNVTVNDGETIIYHQSEERPDISPISEHIHAIPYLKGTLVLGIADKAQSKLVWESVVVSYMDIEPDLSEKNIRNGIKGILKNFPPKK
jgi:Domain of unknown function (DUF4136)